MPRRGRREGVELFSSRRPFRLKLVAVWATILAALAALFAGRPDIIVLVIDQVEELFTVCDDPAERALYATALALAARAADAADPLDRHERRTVGLVDVVAQRLELDHAGRVVVGDDRLKGAGLNTVQIAELLSARGVV